MKKFIVLGIIFFMNTFFINCQTFNTNQNNNEKIEFKVKKREKENTKKAVRNLVNFLLDLIIL